MSRFSVQALFGMDSTNLKTGLKDAEKRIDRFQSLMSKVGVGIGAFTVLRFFQDVIRYANDAEGPLDENTAAVQRFSKGMADAREGALRLGVTLLAQYNKAGEAIGDAIGRLRGFSEEQMRASQQAAEEAARQEEALAELRKRAQAAAENAAKVQQENAQIAERIRRLEISDTERQIELERDILRLRGQQAGLDERAQSSGSGIVQERAAQNLNETLRLEEELARMRQASQRRQQAAEVQIAKLRQQAAESEMSDAEKLVHFAEQKLRIEREIATLPVSSIEGDAKVAELKLEILRITQQERQTQKAMDAEKERALQDEAALRREIEEFQKQSDFGRLNSEQQVRALQQDRLKLEQRRADLVGRGENVEALRVELQIRRTIEQELDLRKRITDEIKDQSRSLKQQADDARRSIEDQRRERTSVSLGALASGEFGRGREARDARRIQKLERRAQRAALRGQDEQAQRLLAEGDVLRKGIPGLSEAEKDPEAAFKSALSEAEKELQAITRELQILRTQPTN